MSRVPGRTPAPKRPTRTRAQILPFPAAATGRERVRWSRVATAQARIAAGYYDRLDVQDLVAGALFDELNRR